MKQIILKTNDGEVTVTSCWKCPKNTEVPNPIAALLPPTHYCSAAFNPSDKNGNIIWNPHDLPGWCPFL